MKITIIDCGSGNLRSAQKAFEKASDDLFKKNNVIISSKIEDIENSNCVVLPGVGAFADFMNGLNKIDGMKDALEFLVKKKGIPFIGICVGMQVLAQKGYENRETDGIGWFKGSVKKINTNSDLPIPQMGWNNFNLKKPHPVLQQITEKDHGYFVHSYSFFSEEPSDVLATVDYGAEIPAIIAKDNIIGVQFHPEKSQEVGLRIISNFLLWAF